MDMRVGLRKAGNAGLVTTTAGPDLLHTIKTVTVQQVSFTLPYQIKKIMWYNNTGGNATIQIGTLSGTPAFVALLPTILAINTFDGEMREDDLPCIEFLSTPGAASGVVAANQRNGNAYVQCSAVGVLITIEVEEYGA